MPSPLVLTAVRLFVRKIGRFLDPPLGADVLNGSPLKTSTTVFRRWTEEGNLATMPRVVAAAMIAATIALTLGLTTAEPQFFAFRYHCNIAVRIKVTLSCFPLLQG